MLIKLFLLLFYLLNPLRVNAFEALDSAPKNDQVVANTAADIKTALAANPDQAASLTAAIVSAAIVANPDQVAAITAAAIGVNPSMAIIITTAAVAVAPSQAAAIAAAANLAVPGQASAIKTAAVTALLTSQGKNIPSTTTSESTVNSIGMSVAVVVNTLDACGNNQACIKNVYKLVAESSSNTTLIDEDIKKEVSPN